jgi:DNA-binding NarL/FixJ family response regulator
MKDERPPFYFLDNSISILLVDDDPGVRALVQEVLKPVRLYQVCGVSSSREAEERLKTPERTHVCVLDLGLSDRENDEFYLLRKFGRRVSFVVFTGSTSPAKGFTARSLGAREIVEKTPRLDMPTFVKCINRQSLLNILNPRYTVVHDTVGQSTELLVEKAPTTVSQWAIQMGITDRELRHIWRKNLGANAKIILSISQIFSAAFSYYEHQIAATDSAAAARLHNVHTYRRLEEYYHCHKSTITDFIAFGNIAMFTGGEASGKK